MEDKPLAYEEIIDDVRARGAEDGKAAASWYFDGNTTPETYARVLEMLDDGDPEILFTLPSAPLSGEWADGLLPRDVLSWYGMSDEDDAADDVLSAYEDAYEDAAASEIERVCRYQLA